MSKLNKPFKIAIVGIRPNKKAQVRALQAIMEYFINHPETMDRINKELFKKAYKKISYGK